MELSDLSLPLCPISQGILLILARKPYNIGDRVVFLDPNAAMNTNGPPAGGWIVEQVDLYTTTVRLGTTREYATFANGSLANSRIINMKRSDKPNIFMYLKFTTNVTKEKLEAFKAEMTKFIKDKPREWIRINGFRCTRVEIEQQYLEFVIIVQHREVRNSVPLFSCVHTTILIVFCCISVMAKLFYHPR